MRGGAFLAGGGQQADTQHDRGFTLIELLIVIVILGVLATVVVFAVRGVTDRGSSAATSADAKTIEHAEEAHMALNGVYASEADLVSAGLMRDESQLHDVDVSVDGSTYSIGAAGAFAPAPTTTIASGGGGGGGTTVPPATTAPPTTAPPTTVPTVPTGYAGFIGQATGSGSRTLVIIGRNSGGNTQVLFDQLTTTPLPDTTVIWLDQNDINETADVDAVIAANPDYMVAADSVPITNSVGGGSTFVGQYMSTLLAYPSQFWWTHQQGNPSNDALLAHL